jgi:hypothetical protein
MRSIPKRFSYANVMSSIAVFVALGGGAYAATGGLVGAAGQLRACVDRTGALRVIRTGSRCRGKSTAVILNQRGLAGATGPIGQPGAPGVTGAQGLTGAPGADGASMLTARSHVSAGGGFFAASGISGENATEAEVTSLSPAGAVVARDLVVRERITASDDDTRIYRLRVNGADTPLSCSLALLANTCTDTGHAVTIPPGSEISIRREQLTGTGGFGYATDVLVAWRARSS